MHRQKITIEKIAEHEKLWEASRGEKKSIFESEYRVIRPLAEKFPLQV